MKNSVPLVSTSEIWLYVAIYNNYVLLVMACMYNIIHVTRLIFAKKGYRSILHTSIYMASFGL